MMAKTCKYRKNIEMDIHHGIMLLTDIRMMLLSFCWSISNVVYALRYSPVAESWRSLVIGESMVAMEVAHALWIF